MKLTVEDKNIRKCMVYHCTFCGVVKVHRVYTVAVLEGNQANQYVLKHHGSKPYMPVQKSVCYQGLLYSDLFECANWAAERTFARPDGQA